MIRLGEILHASKRGREGGRVLWVVRRERLALHGELVQGWATMGYDSVRRNVTRI